MAKRRKLAKQVGNQSNKPKKPMPDEAKPYQFKPGQSGNPNGRPPISPAQRALRNLTVDTYREVIEMVLTGNLKELKALAEHPDTPAIQVGVAASFIKAINRGDYVIIEKIAERIVGKIPDTLNVNSTSKATVTVYIPDNGRTTNEDVNEN